MLVLGGLEVSLHPRTTTAWVYSKTRLPSSFLLALGLTTFAGCPTASVINRGQGWCCSKVNDRWMGGWMDGLKIKNKCQILRADKADKNAMDQTNVKSINTPSPHQTSFKSNPNTRSRTTHPKPRPEIISSSQQPAPNINLKMSNVTSRTRRNAQ